jgi:hypothetical protein
MPSRQSLERLVRRWAWALAGVMVGMSLVAFFAWETYEEHDLWLYKVQALRAAHKAVPAKSAASSPAASDTFALVDRLPAQRDVSGLWLALQQGMTQRGLQVQDMRPQALLPARGLSSQAVALRLQGRFVDGVQVWASLVDSGPVWSLDQLTVTPGAQPGQLQWDGVWRVWLRTDAPSAQAWPALWTQSVQHAQAGVDPFVAAPTLAQQPVASEPLPGDIPADPRHWPLSRIRLLGVWQQGPQLQAVLGAGPHWVVLGAGATLAQEGYRVKTVGSDAVELQATQGRGPVHVLRLEGTWR